MKRTVRSAAAFLIAAALGADASHADAPEWTVDLEESRIGFTAHQMQVSIPGNFSDFAATIRFAADDLDASSAVVVVQVAGVETPNRDIEDAIKLADWFDVARFPQARFETSSIARVEGDRYEAEGVLMLRGVERPLAVPLSIAISEDPDDPGMLRADAVGEVPVSRLAFGIGQGQWEDVSVVADEVVIEIEIVARRPKP